MSAPERIKVAPCHPYKEPDDVYVCHPRLQHPAAVEYIRADLVPQWQPKVKPLKWQNFGWEFWSHSIVGTYTIDGYGDHWTWARDDEDPRQHGTFAENEEAAKAAAQADYERRILSALDTPPEAD